jgi:Leucine-rich repeat (LRR) protein
MHLDADKPRVLPAEYIGKVVAHPLECLPVVNARLVNATVELNLGHRGLELLHGFEAFPNLATLWLNNNRLAAIDNLDANFRLRRLYASHNRIASLRGSLLAFGHLEELDLSHNGVAHLDGALGTLAQLPLLRKLWLHHNPVAQ